MKKLQPIFSLLLFFSLPLFSQEEIFLWAQSYEISECNEVAAIATDSSENIFIAGVHEGPFSLPFKGNIYLIKNDPNGNIHWSNQIEGELIMSDMIAINNEVLILGQAYDNFTYNGIEYGTSGFYQFLLKLDENGDMVWHLTDAQKNVMYGGGLARGSNNQFLVHARTTANEGDYITIMDLDGTEIETRLLHPDITLITDAAFYDEQVYLCGTLNGFSSVVIDTLFIPTNPVESTTFVLSLNNTLTGLWVATDTAFSNGDGRIAANENGVFVYEETLEPQFSIVKYVKKFDFSGNLISEVEFPTYNTFSTINPAMALVGDRLAIYHRNSGGADEFKLSVYDNNLNEVYIKTISGQSDNYSNRITHQDKDFIIAHVFESTINFNGEVSLFYTGGSGKLPYIAMVGQDTGTQIQNPSQKIFDVRIYPNPAKTKLNIRSNSQEISRVVIRNQAGQIVSSNELSGIEKIDVSHLSPGIYFSEVINSNAEKNISKLIISR